MPWRVERVVERGLFAARWLMAPFYVGMVGALVAVLAVFLRELAADLSHLATLDGEAVILLSLSLIDLSLTGNLLLIVIFSGYETFVSRIDAVDAADRPAWMGTVDFSGLKMKLIASIVAISAIALLRAFLPLGEAHAPFDPQRLGWMAGVHLVFVVSGVCLALMDFVSSRTARHVPHQD